MSCRWGPVRSRGPTTQSIAGSPPELLGFPSVTQNSLDAVSDRDFMIEVASALSITMMHLSRLSEELILWSSQEFQFVELPDAFCTGSSMMPQKKNPDVPELVRGKTGRVYGHLVNLLTTLKALPLSYNRDLQEDKPALFDALDTVTASVEVLTELMRRLTVNRDVLKQGGSGWWNAGHGGCGLSCDPRSTFSRSACDHGPTGAGRIGSRP